MLPLLDDVRAYAGEYDVVPVYREIYADVATPIAVLRKLAAVYDKYFLLESIEGGEKWARYSFLGFDPKARLSYKDGVLNVEGEGACRIETKEPYVLLREYMSRYKTPRIEGIPPFTGGLVGYYGYSMIGVAEPVLKLRSGELNDFDLMLFDKVLAYDHLSEKITVIVNMKTDDLERQYQKACDDIEDIIRIINTVEPVRCEAQPVEFKSSHSKTEFCEMVEKTKRFITEGDIFQCVISRRFEADYKPSLLGAYRVLRTTNPSPYMSYMRIGEDELMCASPETLVKLQGDTLTTFPIAGSRPRGADKEEDERLEDELIHDEKELAEHNMLVDLGRNDIGRIAKIGSVRVTEYQKVLRFSKIMHICSEVEGKIREDLDAFDALSALLPAGTLSGAPKIRACQIIEELENCPRGVYGGAIGYIDFNGNLDACIAIRMATKHKDKVYVQAGAGIVADSVPESEYTETYNKALAVMNAIERAEEVADL